MMAAVPARAQITAVNAVKNAGNSPDNFQDGLTLSYQRTSSVGVLSNNGVVAQVRYAEAVGVDAGAFDSGSDTLASDYNINFTVTAPGAYDLNITTSLNGAFTIVDDGDGPGTADMTGVTGTQTGGVLSGGTLNLTDPGGPVTSGNVAITRSSSATIQGTSNGLGVAHTLRFTWSASCSSSNGFLTGGDECAVRLGLPITYSGQSAGSYPGVGGRTAANDGHFVTIALVSLCGDGVVQGSRGEQCDLGGGLNGMPGTCCSSSCQLLPNGATCRAAAGVCDLPETCNGSTPTCPADAKSTALCRASAGVCDVAEFCNGASNTCPADGFASALTLCRAAAGPCDVAENCTGTGPNCPADILRPNGFVCRATAGTCDVAETCNGVSTACPPDGFQSSSTVCRAAAGVCDVAENCTGSGPACPADAVEQNTTVCRPVAGVCDQAENCDGAGVNCPPDVFLGSGMGSFVCRPVAGPCDVQDLCDGTGPNCPPDVVASSSTVCRPAGGVCDLTETCDGVTTGCPADVKSTAVCRAAADVCDVAESCDGVNNACPADAFEPASTVCRPAAGACDVAENCTGSSASCPADTGLPDTDGDTVCDALDNCDGIPNPSQTNADADALGDACDPCTNLVPTGQDKVKLTLTKLLAPATDDKLSFKGFFTSVPATPTIDPTTNGVRILITDSTGVTPIDITIPGGAYNVANRAGWRVNGSGTSWTYKNAGTAVPLVNGIQKVQLKKQASPPGKYKFGVKGKNGNYAVNTANLPLVGTLVIDPPYAATGQCGEAMFPATPPAKPSCLSVSGGKTVKCK
jgi:hypothetical protein